MNFSNKEEFTKSLFKGALSKYLSTLTFLSFTLITMNKHFSIYTKEMIETETVD